MTLRSRASQRFIALAAGSLLVFAMAGPAVAYQVFGGHFSTNCYLKYSYRGSAVTLYKSAFLAGLSSWSSYSGSTTCWQETTAGDWKVGMVLDNNNSVGWDGLADALPSETYVPTSFVYVHFNRFYMDAYSAAEKQSDVAPLSWTVDR